LQEVKLVDNFYWFLTGTIGTPARNGWHQLPGQGGFLNRYIQQVYPFQFCLPVLDAEQRPIGA